MEYENYTFPEALKVLADRAGVHLPEVEYSKEERAKADRRSTLLEINKLAANYFYYQLHQPQGKPGYDYFHRRSCLVIPFAGLDWGLPIRPAMTCISICAPGAIQTKYCATAAW